MWETSRSVWNCSDGKGSVCSVVNWARSVDILANLESKLSRTNSSSRSLRGDLLNLEDLFEFELEATILKQKVGRIELLGKHGGEHEVVKTEPKKIIA